MGLEYEPPGYLRRGVSPLALELKKLTAQQNVPAVRDEPGQGELLRAVFMR